MSIQKDLLHEFEAALLKESFSGSPDELYQPIDYTIRQGGKRMRPLLLLMSCDIFNGKIEDAIYPAIGIELFHNFTLVHDDIMDKAAIRRGKETVYKKWDENIAILSGDTMFALANKYMVKTGFADLRLIMNTFNQTAIEVCEGQQMDMNFEKADNISINDYLEMIRLKTAVLLACSARIGAIIAGAGKEQADLVWDFGINLGLSFQLKDDLLDAFGDEHVFGKRKGGDIASNKKTYLYIKALEKADHSTREELVKLYSSHSLDNEKKIGRVIDIFKKLGINQITEEKIKEYYGLAMKALDHIDIADQKKAALKAYTDELADRER